MGGGLMQLVAYGAQDIYLTGQPQITFFKSVYRRYTNFSMESIEQTINGSQGFGNKISLTISRNGDLLNGVVLEYSPKDVLGGTFGLSAAIGANVGHSLINTIELEIGGQLIDRQYGTWLTIWDYLSTSNPTGVQGVFSNNACAEPTSANSPINQDGQVSTLYDVMSYNHRGSIVATSNTNAPTNAYIPLQFWFCKNPGLAIPLIALQYHEVKINITFNQQSAYAYNITPSGNELLYFKVYADYVYLDTTERRQFAQNAHEYLIEQLQVNESNDISTLLSFNHPIKELIWISTPIDVTNNVNQSGGSSPSAPLSNGDYLLTLNGTNRFSPRDLKYFTREQVNTYHTGFGSVLWPNSIGVYSFAIRPEEHQPSGTCNFSRIDTAILKKPDNQRINIYAINYNILRIMSGMGGLAYSN